MIRWSAQGALRATRVRVRSQRGGEGEGRLRRLLAGDSVSQACRDPFRCEPRVERVEGKRSERREKGEGRLRREEKDQQRPAHTRMTRQVSLLDPVGRTGRR